MNTVIRALIPCQIPNVLIAVETTIGQRLDIVTFPDGELGLKKTPTMSSRVVGLVILG